MSQYTVLFDANVLYPAPMRDALMQLAVSDLFKAKWTADLHREWIDALLRYELHRDRAALEQTRDFMGRATRDCLVTGYEALVPALTLPDPDDRHVLASRKRFRRPPAFPCGPRCYSAAGRAQGQERCGFRRRSEGTDG